MTIREEALITREILAQSDLHRQRAIAEFILNTAAAADHLLRTVNLSESGGHPGDSRQARQYIETKIREAFYELLGEEFPVPISAGSGERGPSPLTAVADIIQELRANADIAAAERAFAASNLGVNPFQPVHIIEAPATGIEPVRSPHTPARVPVSQDRHEGG